MLKVENLNVYYGGIHALKGVDIEVNQGEIVSIIGSNGAGKSTLLNSISGIVKPKEGIITYKGKEISKLPHKIVKQGICQVPEGRHIFANLTVKENLLMGAYIRNDKDKIQKDLENVYNLFPRLKERTSQMAGTLSGGEQQMLAIGRGLMSDPELILLDEPSLGLAPLIIKTIFEIIQQIKNMNKTILLVEQNAYQALAISDKAYVLEQGRIVTKGYAKDLINDASIQEAYLGKKK
ncbi:amino acid/amide ABC transporter ATP-binding protein 2, HAAT family (TC 3.A.1.4.-) [Alkalithermobacter thermoalcaliphilus JW-YL-7 = DSM 7308]|uniref:Amino acid/amide ABC transporter ATP-binding protein 2, HAAT family (TC 3.A.1.4.-) n=1 Tax=Alkalithermobacter thermoalcaliphilus JW-YL-7 = DSM 7308 TaxID=1121328 RepID=A0A150FNC7_CLOPD|nr:Phosphonate-transporting ATPase [[Clostridium] paradoxum JW-YL-7 = DSM 7308]SHK91626.1 amino acid/amide ABC transporter ATP-binding protein 2, HAAT family (TC 3.A.1.4.-) [[Clostridium] paradoxum JW-YL-7 = DSM 7308]